MRVSNKLTLLLVTLCFVPLIASADVLMLKDGQAITGDFMGADQATVSFQVNGEMRRYQISVIQSVTFTTSGARSSAAEGRSSESRPAMRRRSEPPNSPEPTYGPPPSADWAGSAPAPSATSSAPAPRGVSVHAGSLITVRMIDPVDSSVNQIGEMFRATLDEPLVVDGETVVPRGVDVTAKLVSKAEAGRITGR